MTRHRPKGRGKRANTNSTAEIHDDGRGDLIDKGSMNNERFFSYCKAQKLIPEEEWEEFVEALRRPLPTTFRVAGSRQTANTLNATIRDVHVPNLSNVVFEGQAIPPPVQLPWYPDGLGWQFNVPKKVLRKQPEFKKFHSFLVFETEVGNISRQEGVSMIPPLFLEVEPHHKVMDMCAAPGSKTAQILEALHAQDTLTSASIPSGVLIANDSDNKRTHLLIHQSARLPSPALMVTNLDASNYPTIKIPSATGGLTALAFDRILCDVPCSGDGTIRKNIGIWKTWGPMDGNGLHSLQVRILLRAMRLLRNDGRIVYSTCSLNPVENEAVIAEALSTNPDFELVDVSGKFPDLKRRPGLTTWRATTDRSCATTFESYEEFMASSVADDTTKAKMSEGHWPPKNVESLNLPFCMRIYPHLQDSGGFFVAVLEKKKKVSKAQSERKRPAIEGTPELPESKKPKLEESGSSSPPEGDLIPAEPVDESESKIDSPIQIDEVTIEVGAETSMALEESVGTGASTPVGGPSQPRQPRSKRERGDGGGSGSFKENPYTFLPPDGPILQSCIERLHIDPNAFPLTNVLVRNPEGEAARVLYLANDIVKAIILNNSYERLRLTAAGTKIFAKQEGSKGTPGSEAQFRVLGEGLPVVLPFVDEKTIIEGDHESLKILVESYYPLCAKFPEAFKHVVEARPSGSHVVRFPEGTSEIASLTHPLILPIWKSNVSLTLMIDKKAKSALSLRLFGADITTAGKEKAAQSKDTIQDAVPKEEAAIEAPQES